MKKPIVLFLAMAIALLAVSCKAQASAEVEGAVKDYRVLVCRVPGGWRWL